MLGTLSGKPSRTYIFSMSLSKNINFILFIICIVPGKGGDMIGSSENLFNKYLFCTHLCAKGFYLAH